jgi:hypothetical protein
MSADRALQIQSLLANNQGKSPQEQAEIVAAAIPPPSTKVAGWLWLVLVVTLGIVVVLSAAGVIWTVVRNDITKTPDVIVTVFTTSLAGLLGLFVKTPDTSG